MKTQCPHCQAKFKASDESKGKKVNCPKCNQQFVISPLIKDKTVEVCSNCGEEIRKLEQPCVFKDEIVCAECDKKLRNTVDRRDNQDNAKKDIGNQLAKSEQGMSPKFKNKDNLVQLQKAAHYFIITKTIKSPATYTFGSSFGLIIAGIVLLCQSHEIAALFFIFLAVPVLFVSLFALLRPSPKSLILQGIVLTLGGIFLFFIGITSLIGWYTAYENSSFPADRPAVPPLMFGYFLAGFAAIVWSIPHFFQYARFSNIQVKKPAGNDIDIVKKIANSIDSANPKTSSSIIEFVVQTFWGKQIWKGRLSENSAVFVRTGIEDIIFSRKDHVWISKIEQTACSETQKVQVKLGTRILDGSISSTFLDRYQQWKEGQ